MKLLFQLKTPIKQANEAGDRVDYFQVAGDFEADDTNAWATTVFGTLVIPRENIGPFAMFLNDDIDLGTLNKDLVLVVN